MPIIGVHGTKNGEDRVQLHHLRFECYFSSKMTIGIYTF